MSISGLLTLVGAGNGEIDKNIAESIPGAGAVTMNGTGTWNLAGTNSYTGNTTVNAGTLKIAQPTLATNSTVTVAAGAKLELDFAATNSVAALVLNGTNEPVGVYNHSTTPGFFPAASVGSLLVTGTAIASNPTNIMVNVNGNTLGLSWPLDHLGWLMQSNSQNLAVTTDWFDISNTATGTNYNITIDPTQKNVFYRLRHP